jgi:hypothetical protein
MKRLISSGAVLLSLVIGTASNLFACWGTRPLSMGGAFVAVSDDVHSIYWNPAGLSKVKNFELTYTRWLDRRDEVNYDDFAAGAISRDFFALGMSFTYNQDKFDHIDTINGNTYRMQDWQKDTYINLGFGAALGKAVSIGLNIKSCAAVLGKSNLSTHTSVSSSDSTCLLDFGLLWDASPKLALGVLGQNFNEPKMFDGKYIFNLRPGIAWKPTTEITFAFDLYNLLDYTDPDGESDRNIRIGMEAWASKNLAFRLGCYSYYINRRNDNGPEAYTGGLGWKVGRWKVDYGFMYWTNAGYIQHLLAFGYAY